MISEILQSMGYTDMKKASSCLTHWKGKAYACKATGLCIPTELEIVFADFYGRPALDGVFLTFILSHLTNLASS